VRVRFALQDTVRELDRRTTVALALKARAARVELVEAFLNDCQIGTRHGVVETHQNIALLDAVAVANIQLADNAAGRMLDLLDVGIDDDRALRNQRSGQRHGAGPAADTEGEDQDDDEARHDVALDRSAGIQNRRLAHDLATPVSGTTLSGRAPAFCCSTRASTSSLGPNAWARPWPIISRRSTPAMALGR